jgi:hypothetical protein
VAKLTYNGVTIPYLMTRGYQADVVYTEDRADYLYTRHRCHVEGLLWASGAPGGTGKVADWFRSVRHDLEQPRKDLRYEVNGAVVVRSDRTADLSNGPHPELVAFERVLGSEAVRVVFVVTTDLWGCGEVPPDYLSNRWSESESIDRNWLSRLTRTGKVVLGLAAGPADRSERGDKGRELRDLITPPIALNYNRISADYKFASDGLSMSYTFVDQQVESQPPGPAVNILDATYTETAQNAAKRYGEVRVALKGIPQPWGSRDELLARAITCCVRRLQWAGALIPGRADCPVTTTLSERLDRNEVTVTMRTMIPPTVAAAGVAEDKATARSAIVLGTTVAGGILGAIATGGPWGAVGGGTGGALVGKEIADALVGKVEAAIPRLPENLAGWGGVLDGSLFAGTPAFPAGGYPGIRLLSAALNDPCLKKVADAAGAAAGPPDALPLGGVSPLTSPPPAYAGPVPDPTVQVVDALDGDAEPLGRSLGPVGVYSEVRVRTHWLSDPHVAQLASTDSEGTDAFVAYANPSKQLVIDYQAEKVGGPPSVPPEDIGPNFVLLDHQRSPESPDLAADGITATVRLAGTMVFGVRNPALVVEAAAAPPWWTEQLRYARSSQSPDADAQEKYMHVLQGAAGGLPDPALVNFDAVAQVWPPTRNGQQG